MFPKGSGFLITNKYHIFSLLTLLSYFYSQTRDAKTSFAKRLNDIKLLERSIVMLACLYLSIYTVFSALFTSGYVLYEKAEDSDEGS